MFRATTPQRAATPQPAATPQLAMSPIAVEIVTIESEIPVRCAEQCLSILLSCLDLLKRRVQLDTAVSIEGVTYNLLGATSFYVNQLKKRLQIEQLDALFEVSDIHRRLDSNLSQRLWQLAEDSCKALIKKIRTFDIMEVMRLTEEADTAQLKLLTKRYCFY